MDNGIFVSDTFDRKLKLINSMQPRALKDFLPLMALDESKLAKLINRLTQKTHLGVRNLIYYLGERLEVIGV